MARKIKVIRQESYGQVRKTPGSLGYQVLNAAGKVVTFQPQLKGAHGMLDALQYRQF